MTLDADAKRRLERAIVLANASNISIRSAVAKAMVDVNESARRIYLFGVLIRAVEKARKNTEAGPAPSKPRVANPEFIITPQMRNEAKQRELFHASRLSENDK
jgi:hypothetical protein